MEDCPALPQPLARILGIRSRIIDNHGRVLCRERGALAANALERLLVEAFALVREAEARRHGVCGVLRKPVDADALRALMQRCVKAH